VGLIALSVSQLSAVDELLDGGYDRRGGQAALRQASRLTLLASSLDVEV